MDNRCTIGRPMMERTMSVTTWKEYLKYQSLYILRPYLKAREIVSKYGTHSVYYKLTREPDNPCEFANDCNCKGRKFDDLINGDGCSRCSVIVIRALWARTGNSYYLTLSFVYEFMLYVYLCLNWCIVRILFEMNN